MLFRRSAVLAAAFLSVFSALACSSTTTGGGNGGGGSGAVGQCQSFENSICQRLESCVPDAGATMANCAPTLDMTLNCGKAVSVTSNYNTCMNTVSTASCDTLFPNAMLALPTVCDGVIQE